MYVLITTQAKREHDIYGRHLSQSNGILVKTIRQAFFCFVYEQLKTFGIDIKKDDNKRIKELFLKLKLRLNNFQLYRSCILCSMCF